MPFDLNLSHSIRSSRADLPIPRRETEQEVGTPDWRDRLRTEKQSKRKASDTFGSEAAVTTIWNSCDLVLQIGRAHTNARLSDALLHTASRALEQRWELEARCTTLHY